MSGYSTYTRWQRIEAEAQKLGFRLGPPKHGWSSTDDLVTLYPYEQALPVFARDTDIFTGTFGQIETFLNGWIRARQYDSILGAVNDQRRKKYEDNELARQAAVQKKAEQAEMIKVLRASDAENQSKKK